MEKLILWFVIVAGSLAQQDLGSKVLLFAKPTATAHVILKPVVTKPLNKLTVCVRSYTELTREHPLFSLAIAGSGKDNTFLIFPRPPNFCSVYIGQEEIRIKVDTEVLDWKHTCVSWESQSGVIQLWINGKLYPRRVSRKGFIIPPETSIVLGQEQDSFGGGFDVNQSFVGEISDVHVWDYVLNPEDIKGVLSNEKNGNLISWTSLNYELKGDVTAEPKLQSCFDLGSKVFLFPKSTASAYVILKPMVSKPLNKLTVCLRSYTELTREHSLFSLAMPGPGKDNTFLIFPRPPNFCSVYIGQEETRIKVDAEVLDWKHTCVSWDSYTGVIQLWVNGKLYPRRVSKKGFTIAPQTSIVLGQEQDSFGGGFDVNQSFMGEISDVHMWNYSLTPDDIQKVVFNNKALNGNVISWRSLQYEINGEALVQHKLQCKISEYTYSTYSKCYEEHLHDKVICS